ncbi:MAG: tyrosine-type recombinase/integrase, partial [Candidatus Bipolaricaulota bacterium]
AKVPDGELSTKPEIEITEAIDDFQLITKVDGRAKATVDQYDYVLERFVDYSSEDIEIGNITTENIRRYLADLMDEGLKNTTVAIHYRVLNRFFNWLLEENYLLKNPLDPINEPETPNIFPKVLNEEQVKILLQAAKNRQREWANKRNHTMLIVFVDMGLRLSELINAQLDDLDMKRRSLKVRGKGANYRKVFFGKRTFRALKKWLRVRGNVERVWGDTVFISQKGEKLKKRNIQRLISRIQKSAGLEDVKISPHVLRHTAATLAVQNGLDTFSLKTQFGWEQIDTALKYVHLSGKKLQENYRNCSPADNLDG